MLRAIAAATLCTAMFAAGAEAAPYRITANGIAAVTEGAYAPGGVSEVPIGSSMSIDLVVDVITPTYDVRYGDYWGGSTGPGGTGVASFGGVDVLTLAAPDSYSDNNNDVVVDAVASASEFGGLIAPGTYDLFSFSIMAPLSATGGRDSTAWLYLFAPQDTFENGVAVTDLPLGSVSMLLGFWSSTIDLDPDTGAPTVVRASALASVSSLSVAPVPLPAAAPLLVAGLAGLGLAGRRRVRP